MKNKYSILVLTDHKTHSKVDSFYKLVNELKTHVLCNKLAIASRSYSKNSNFFTNPLNEKLYATEMFDTIDYEEESVFYDDSIELNIEEYDVVMLRIDKPIPDLFFENLEERLGDKIFINSPKGIVKTGGKEYLLNFPQLTPQTLLCTGIGKILEISAQKEVVIKPLNEGGGNGIARMYKDDYYIENTKVDLKSISEHISSLLKRDKKVVVMDFLKEVTQGDKRTLVVNGHIIGSILRVASSNSWMCNLSKGAKVVKADTNIDEKNIINKINPALQQEGIVIYGIDTLVDNEGKSVLSEINTANVGGFTQVEDFSNKPIMKETVEWIFEYIKSRDNNL